MGGTKEQKGKEGRADARGVRRGVGVERRRKEGGTKEQKGEKGGRGRAEGESGRGGGRDGRVGRDTGAQMEGRLDEKKSKMLRKLP